MGKIATELYASKIGGKNQEIASTEKCVTKDRATSTFGCTVDGNYLPNQLVQESDLMSRYSSIYLGYKYDINKVWFRILKDKGTAALNSLNGTSNYPLVIPLGFDTGGGNFVQFGVEAPAREGNLSINITTSYMIDAIHAFPCNNRPANSMPVYTEQPSGFGEVFDYGSKQTYMVYTTYEGPADFH